MNVPQTIIFLNSKFRQERSVFACPDCHACFQEIKLYSLLKGSKKTDELHTHPLRFFVTDI